MAERNRRGNENPGHVRIEDLHRIGPVQELTNEESAAVKGGLNFTKIEYKTLATQITDGTSNTLKFEK